MSKIRIQHCVVCDKETEHTTPIYGIPFTCSNSHPYDNTHCRGCGIELDKRSISIIAILGAAHVYCKKCTNNRAP